MRGLVSAEDGESAAELGLAPPVCTSESGGGWEEVGPLLGKEGDGVIFRSWERREKQIRTQANTSKIKQTHFVRVLESKWRR